MNPWNRELARTSSVAAVIDIAQDYLDQWGPQDLVQLPETCRPGRVKSAEDIHFWYTRLAENYVGSHDAALDSDRHSEMLAFFVAAVERVSVLSSTEAMPPPDRAEAERPAVA